MKNILTKISIFALSLSVVACSSKDGAATVHLKEQALSFGKSGFEALLLGDRKAESMIDWESFSFSYISLESEGISQDIGEFMNSEDLSEKQKVQVRRDWITQFPTLIKKSFFSRKATVDSITWQASVGSYGANCNGTVSGQNFPSIRMNIKERMGEKKIVSLSF